MISIVLLLGASFTGKVGVNFIFIGKYERCDNMTVVVHVCTVEQRRNGNRGRGARS